MAKRYKGLPKTDLPDGECFKQSSSAGSFEQKAHEYGTVLYR